MIGFNIYNPDDYYDSGVGFGHTLTLILMSDQESEYTLYYELGVSEANDEVPLQVPS